MEQLHSFLNFDTGGVYSGKHLLIEVCNAKNLDDEIIIQSMLRQSAEVAGATILHLHTHVFTPNGGISGVAILAESHISIHSWPEISYAAVDVFMCGETHPELTVDVIKQVLNTNDVYVSVHKRGQGVI